ncbi:hypothetical protein [Halovenus sp. HT40]|uniref:hypothetical protein n=1 Tax=Halovenus sp. HT40 TaxID=3126691 RepID=UPI00300F1C3A
MSFEYNEINLDEIESVELVEGNISPTPSNEDTSSTELSKEQKRKTQLVELLDTEFEAFHSFFDELLASYYGYGRRNEFLSETLGVPDYVKCDNCSSKRTSQNGNPICAKTAEENEDGQTVYKVIPDTQSVPAFCSHRMRYVSYPEQRLSDVDDEILSIAERGYADYVADKKDTYKERREQALTEGRTDSDYVTKDLSSPITSKEEYTARELSKLTRSLFDPADADDFRQSALRLAWLLHLDDVLEEEYYPQRAEAYLRAMDSPHQNDTLPGQGGDEFEEDVRAYLSSLGFPLFNRVFEIEGIESGHKEMDVYTQFPWGQRAIFEVFTTGAHGDKDKQLQQYADLLHQAENVDAAQLLFTDGYLSNQTVQMEFLLNLLTTDVTVPADVEPPGNALDSREMPDVQHVGNAENLSYHDFTPDFEPVEASKTVESRLMAKLRGLGYDPTLPVYRYRNHYGLCGPTIQVGGHDKNLSITFFANREDPWAHEDEEAHTRKDRMVKKKDAGYGYEWTVESPHAWRGNLPAVTKGPVVVVEVSQTPQQKLHSITFDRLLRETPENSG